MWDLVRLSRLLSACFRGLKLVLVTLPVIETTLWIMVCLCMTLVQVSTPVVSGAPPDSLVRQVKLLMSLSRFRCLSDLVRATRLTGSLSLRKCVTLAKTRWRGWAQKLLVIICLVILL